MLGSLRRKLKRTIHWVGLSPGMFVIEYVSLLPMNQGGGISPRSVADITYSIYTLQHRNTIYTIH